MKQKNCMNSLTWALFQPYNGFWATIKHAFKDIPIVFYRLRFLLKHGYSEPATWETRFWFICWAREVITSYRYNRNGTPVTFFTYGGTEEQAIASYNQELDRMLELLDIMEKCDDLEHPDELKAAKDEFFTLFSKNYFNFWD